MSKLVRRILAPLALIGALAATPVAAQGTSVSASVGGFGGAEKAMQDIYGPMWKFRGTIDFELSKSFRLEGGVSYMSKDGNPYTVGNVTGAKSNISFIQGEALAIYTSSGSFATGRFGAGVVYTSITENLSGNFGGQSASAAGSVSGPGLVGLVGAELALGDKLSICSDLMFTYIPFQAADGSSVNLGGTSIDIGARIKF